MRGVEDPDQGVDELLHQPGLAQREQPAVAPGHAPEHLPRGQRRGGAGGGLLAAGPGQGLAHAGEQQRQRQQDAGEAEARECYARLPGGGEVAGEDAGGGHPQVARELVQPDREAALVGARQVELAGLRRRPAQALVDAEQQGRQHDAAPVLGPQHQRRRGQRGEPAGEQHRAAAAAVGEAPGGEVHGALDEAEGDDEGGQQQERAGRDAELALGQRRRHGAHHAEGHADQEHLGQLLAELGEVAGDAVLHGGHCRRAAGDGPRAGGCMRLSSRSFREGSRDPASADRIGGPPGPADAAPAVSSRAGIGPAGPGPLGRAPGAEGLESGKRRRSTLRRGAPSRRISSAAADSHGARLLAMKTTLDLDGRLLQEAEARAASEGRTLAQLVEEALRGRVRGSAAPDDLNLLVKPGWLKPGVDIDIDNRNSLYDQLDDLN